MKCIRHILQFEWVSYHIDINSVVFIIFYIKKKKNDSEWICFGSFRDFVCFFFLLKNMNFVILIYSELNFNIESYALNMYETFEVPWSFDTLKNV